MVTFQRWQRPPKTNPITNALSGFTLCLFHTYGSYRTHLVATSQITLAFPKQCDEIPVSWLSLKEDLAARNFDLFKNPSCVIVFLKADSRYFACKQKDPINRYCSTKSSFKLFKKSWSTSHVSRNPWNKTVLWYIPSNSCKTQSWDPCCGQHSIPEQRKAASAPESSQSMLGKMKQTWFYLNCPIVCLYSIVEYWPRCRELRHWQKRGIFFFK